MFWLMDRFAKQGAQLDKTRLSFALALALTTGGTAAESERVLDRWIAAQTNVQTWTAQAVQTRTFETLAQPLVSTGRVWVALPDRFRWELGQPARTIAVRQPKTLYLVYPRLKQVEKYSLDSQEPGPWRDALALLEASFPRNRADLESQFRVVLVTESNRIAQVEMQPRSTFARKFIAAVQVRFDTEQYLPLSTELRFSNGAMMRNDFTHGVINQPVAPDLFEPPIAADYKVVEPLKASK